MNGWIRSGCRPITPQPGNDAKADSPGEIDSAVRVDLLTGRRGSRQTSLPRAAPETFHHDHHVGRRLAILAEELPNY